MESTTLNTIWGGAGITLRVLIFRVSLLFKLEILGNRMDEWEYCLLWASPRKTVVIKPGGQMEKFTGNSQSTGILAGLQADGWQTVTFDIQPTVDMTYLFKRRLQTQAFAAEDKPIPHAPIYSQAPRSYPQAGVSQH